jgi:hypothetical protein
LSLTPFFIEKEDREYLLKNKFLCIRYEVGKCKNLRVLGLPNRKLARPHVAPIGATRAEPRRRRTHRKFVRVLGWRWRGLSTSHPSSPSAPISEISPFSATSSPCPWSLRRPDPPTFGPDLVPPGLLAPGSGGGRPSTS